jgi:membrane-bound lytic murein transglycosylase B
MCYWTREKIKMVKNWLIVLIKNEYSIEARTQWCNNQYSALEKITSNLGLDINKVPFSPDFGIGYTQFQPTTWLQYKELKNKNPWNLEDSLYAAALKLKYDGIHDNEWKAVWSIIIMKII